MQQNLHTVSRSINSQAAHIRNSLSEMEKMLDKIASNEDIKNKKELEQMDIKVITIWECEIKDCFQYRMESLLEEIKEKR